MVVTATTLLRIAWSFRQRRLCDWSPKSKSLAVAVVGQCFGFGASGARRQVAEKADKAGEVGLLIVVEGEVAASGAVKIATARKESGHHLHVGGVHGVVTGADDQRRHLYTLEVGD